MPRRGQKTHRLGTIGIIGLISFAVIADLINWVPFLGTIVSPVFWIGATLYLYTKGFGLINARRLATSGISMVAEMVPAIQAMPMITAGALAIILMSRLEEKTGINPSDAGGDSARPTLNTAGRREPEQPQAPEPIEPSEEGVQGRNIDLAPLNTGGVRQPSR